jgi:hypothetical protein
MAKRCILSRIQLSFLRAFNALCWVLKQVPKTSTFFTGHTHTHTHYSPLHVIITTELRISTRSRTSTFRLINDAGSTTQVICEWTKYSYGQNYALLGYYAASSSNLLPTFRDNLSVPSSREEHVVRAEEKRNAYRVVIGKPVMEDKVWKT